MILLAEHPIEGLMTTAMESIKDMVDVNTIVGDAVQTPDGTVIIPISKVSFGFASGGGEYGGKSNMQEDGMMGTGDNEKENKYPFAGGSGAGVSIHPVAFMVVGNNKIKLLPVNVNSSLNRILDVIPDFLNNMNESLNKDEKSKKSKQTDKVSEDEGMKF